MSWPDDELDQKDQVVRIEVEEEPAEDLQREIYRQSLLTGVTPGSVKLKVIEQKDEDDSFSITTKDPLSRFLIWLFVPVFDELAAGLMAYLCGLTYWFHLSQHPFVLELWQDKTPVAYLLAGVYVVIAFLSIYHVFRDVPKTQDTKRLLAVFSAICCVFSGIMGGVYLFQYGPNSYFQLFGIWNMVQGVVLLFLLYFRYLDERHFTDRDTPLTGAIFNFGIVSLLYFFLKNFTSLFWVDCFAISVAYIMTFSSFVCDQISPPPPPAVDKPEIPEITR